MSPTIDETHILYADLDPTEGVVLHLGTKNYYRLNETAQRVWQGLSSGRSAEDIATELSEGYDVTPEAARADVEEILLLMKREKLVA